MLKLQSLLVLPTILANSWENNVLDSFMNSILTIFHKEKVTHVLVSFLEQFHLLEVVYFNSI